MRTALTTTLSEADLDLITRVHGHICPMALLGARLALAAAAHYRKEAPGEGLPFGFFRGTGCAVDGIQLFSGCTVGNGNLLLLRGRTMEFILTSEESDAGVMAAPLPAITERIREERSAFLESDLGRTFTEVDAAQIILTRRIAGLSSLTRFPGS